MLISYVALSLRACAQPPCGIVLKIFASLRPDAFALNSAAFSADTSLTPAPTKLQFAQRWHSPVNPLHLC